MREGAVQIVDDEVVEPVVGSRPPGWLIVVVVAIGLGVASFVVSQASNSSDPAPDAVPSSLDGAPLMDVTSETPTQLRGYVAVTSPDQSIFGESVWMFRTGGSLVSRTLYSVQAGTDPYPLLMTAGRLMFSGTNGWTFDIDLVEPPTLFGTNRDIIPGAEPGIVWFARLGSGPSGNHHPWVAPVDVESLTVGDRVDITDVFTHPVVGVADGLIVVPIDQETHGRFAYWSPTGGLELIGLRDPSQETVVGASGNLVVVVALRGAVSIFDMSLGDYVSSFPFDFGDAVTSACLSPDREHVVVVGSNGDAVVGNTVTGAVVDLSTPYYDLPPSIQQKHGIGWTADDQVVFIAGEEAAKQLFVADIPSGNGFPMADLEGHGEWWLAANGTMC